MIVFCTLGSLLMSADGLFLVPSAEASVVRTASKHHPERFLSIGEGLPAVAEAVLARIDGATADGGEPRFHLVAVAGLSGSGKSFFCHALQDVLEVDSLYVFCPENNIWGVGEGVKGGGVHTEHCCACT